ncbi:MAG: mechanosensitive ion channel [Bifidobacteriaceae bacterium]|nr:mechanosensitive ion channel [Bifidobacteriaceae bacterium]
MSHFITWFNTQGDKIITFIIALAVTFVITQIIAKIMRTALHRSQIPSASIFINTVRIILWVIALCSMMSGIFGINISTFITALGVGGVAISLGVKDSVSNMVGGFTLMIGKVIQPGDLVSINGTRGIVTDITWRQTVIRERNGNSIVIPNSTLTTATLERLTPRNESAIVLDFEASPNADKQSITDVFEKAILTSAAQYMNKNEAISVNFTSATADSIGGTVTFHAKLDTPITSVKDAIIQTILTNKALEDNIITNVH